MALRSEVLGVMGTYTVDDIDGKVGRDRLANSMKDAINLKREDLEGFGGVEGVHFTSYVLQ
jgi:flagellar FliL protein